MADLIDRDLTIHELEAFKESRSANLLRMSFDDVIDVVNGISAVDRWISVKDALPEQDGFYLAYFTFKDGTHATDIAYINTGCNLGSITHWMPMPEPPEVNKDEAD